MQNIQNLTVELNKKPFEILTANEGEVGSRFARVTILDKSLPFDLTGVTVYLYGLKPDKTLLFNPVTVEDAKKGIVLAELTSQVLAVEGLVKLTLSLEKSGKKLATKQILLKVDSCIVGEGAIESTNEFGILNEALNKVDEFNDYFEETSGKIEEKYTTRLNELDTQLETIEKKRYLLLEHLKTCANVTFYGDSITAGVGSSGYGLTSNLIGNIGGTDYFYANDTSNCYVNLFRRFLNKNYPSINVVNRGIGGKSAKWANTNKAQYVVNNDIAFVMFGTNDRWDSLTINEFKTNLKEFVDYVKTKSNFVVVMAPQPAQEYEDDGTLTSPHLRDTREINKAIAEVCIDNKYLFISHYDMFYDYITTSGQSFDYLLETKLEGGSHPKDPGYELIWRNIQSYLMLKDNYSMWKSLLGGSEYRIRNNNHFSLSKPITDYKRGVTSIFEISSSHTDLANLPGGVGKNGGEIRIVRGYLNDLYTYMVYTIRQTNEVWYSYWDYAGNKWSTFVKVQTVTPIKESLTISNITIPANSNTSGSVAPTLFSIVNSKNYAITPTVNTLGVVFSWSISGGGFFFRFYNLTSNPITIPTFAFNAVEVISQ